MAFVQWIFHSWFAVTLTLILAKYGSCGGPRQSMVLRVAGESQKNRDELEGVAES